MDKAHNYLAFDIGATSGRSMIGTLQNGELKLKELTRFSNEIVNIQGNLFWNIYSLYESLLYALQEVSRQNINLDSIGIDTWGVDFVKFSGDETLITLPRCYRDPYTLDISEQFFKKISRSKLYQLTGVQIMNFNTLFQLYAQKEKNSSVFRQGQEDGILFLPDALSFLLTGEKICEYTIASTSQLLNPETRQACPQLYEILQVDRLLEPIVMPGHRIGYLHPSIMEKCHLGNVPLIAVAGHDTASAVVSVPAEDKNFAYLSSGTWSLMGIEVDKPIVTQDSFKNNFTNEGGVNGTIRFLKNIAGMWLLEECRREWKLQGKDYDYNEIVEMSKSVEHFRFLVDPDASEFSNPSSMLSELEVYCRNTGQGELSSDAEVICCIFDSLAFKYKYIFDCLQEMSPFKIEKLYIIGGGAQNELLNQMTANALNLPVYAGPSEATAIGNIMVQAMGTGVVNNLSEIRNVIRNSMEIKKYLPADVEVWKKQFERYKQIIN